MYSSDESSEDVSESQLEISSVTLLLLALVVSVQVLTSSETV